LERSISRQWSSLGLEERRPFYEEAERIREALQQSHLPNHIQVCSATNVDITRDPGTEKLVRTDQEIPGYNFKRLPQNRTSSVIAGDVLSKTIFRHFKMED